MSGLTIFAARGGFGIGSIIGWFIRVVIYDICISTIQEVLGVNRFVALLIFLGILTAIAIGGYFLKQRVAPGIED